MLHQPAVKSTQVDHASAGKAKLGLWLFAVYCVVYAGFVVINTLKPKWMGVKTVLGLNLAVAYGFGLILLAVIMGLVYNALCNRMEERMNKPAGEGR